MSNLLTLNGCRSWAPCGSGIRREAALQKQTNAEVLPSAFHDKGVSFGGEKKRINVSQRPPPSSFARIISICFDQAICTTSHCCYCCEVWHGPTPWISRRAPQSIIKCDVFICCNLFSSSLLHTILYWILWMVCALLLCRKWFSWAPCFSLTAGALTWIAALSEAKPEPGYSYSE